MSSPAFTTRSEVAMVGLIESVVVVAHAGYASLCASNIPALWFMMRSLLTMSAAP